MLPGTGKDQYGNDVLLGHCQYHDPDVVITLVDHWVFNPDMLRAVGKVYGWAPVDHDPIPPTVVRNAQASRGMIAFSRFGEQQMKAAGLRPYYVPHGVDSNLYAPVPMNEARQALGLPEETFIAGMVLANKGTPSRKAFDQQFRAFAAFQKHHPNSILYIHSDKQGVYGENLERLLELSGMNRENVRFVNQYQYLMGMFAASHMAKTYSACDVILNATRGEGFGIPIVEAQMCGAPVVVTDFSAMPELCHTGWTVGYSDLFFTTLDSYQCTPDVDDITAALEQAFKHKGDEDFRRKARADILEYDADYVTVTYWKPVLERIEAELKRDVAAKQPITIPARNGKVHDWYPVGVYDKGVLCTPSRNSNAELRQYPDGRTEIIPDGWDTTVNGIELDIEDDPQGGVSKIICREIQNTYQLDGLDIPDGGIILDIGAQVGVVSVYLAKRYPQARVIAFEPMPENFHRLLRNVRVNDATNVTAINKAVTADGRKVVLKGNLHSNSGGASIYGTGEHGGTAESTTLHRIFEEYAIDRVNLLKIDCEGAEYEIIYGAGQLLRRVDHIRGESHFNAALKTVGYTPERLYAHLSNYAEDVLLSPCPIGEPPEGVTIWQQPKPRISVVMPVYNGKDTIDRALQSVIRQDVPLEVIIVDDQSTDGTWKHLRKWRGEYHIQVYKNPEAGGPVGALNTAIEYARGEYIIKLDADDWYEDGALNALMDALDAHPEVGFVYGACQYHDQLTSLYKPKPFTPGELLERNPVIGEMMYRAEAHRKGVVHRGFIQEQGRWFGPHDWDLVLQLVHNLGWTGLALPDITVLHYTYHNGGVHNFTQRHKPEVLDNFKRVWLGVTAKSV